MEKSGSAALILDLPFFTLEYRDGLFRRLIPNDAEDLSDGLFKWKGQFYRLPPGVNEALGKTEIMGKALLSLLNRGPNPLIKKGPRLAADNEKLTGLRLGAGPREVPAGSGKIIVELCFPLGGPDNPAWLPLAGLPRHRLFQNIIYEIIDNQTIAELAETWGGKGNDLRVTEPEASLRLVLSSSDLPRFADECGLLIHQFGDQKLKDLLSPNSIFVSRNDLSLVLGTVRGKNDTVNIDAFLVWENTRYPAREISARMDREYILLEHYSQTENSHNAAPPARWARQEDLRAAGILPLCCYAGGMAIEKIRGVPAAFARDSGLRLASGSFDENFSDIKIVPPEQAPGEPEFTYNVEEKFSGLSGPLLYSELALINADGQPAPFVPLRLLKGSLNIDRMDENERAFYLYWRSEFRRRNFINTDETYIRVYARELCVLSGDSGGIRKNFLLLVRLWQNYRAVHKTLDSFLPRWLFDFQAVYEIADFAFPLLLSMAEDSDDPLLCDIYIRRRFIAGNNRIRFDDISRLVPGISDGSARSGFPFPLPPEPVSPLLIRDFETAINAIDRVLREEYHIRLFEFFYPPARYTEKREAFSGMERAGRSVYSFTGIRFSRHPPFLEFLESLFRYIEYRFKTVYGTISENQKKCPRLKEPWKHITDAALGYGETEARGLPIEPEPMDSLPGRIRLSEDSLKQLRGDSDAVRELLAVEKPEKSGVPDPAQEPRIKITRENPLYERQDKTPLKNILEALSATEIEALRIIAGDSASSRAELETLAKKHDTMPELLVDRINAVFLDKSGDLLIDTVDERPLVQSEYREELYKFLKEKDRRKQNKA